MRYLIEGGMVNDETKTEKVSHFSIKYFVNDEEAMKYAKEVRETCQFDFVEVWNHVGQDRVHKPVFLPREPK